VLVLLNEKGGENFAAVYSRHFLGDPIAELQELPDLAPFMAILEGFLGMMLGFTKRMFRIPDGFTHYF
jgi:hypothetical protein